MSKFWMNITSSNQWTGTPVGIIRVENQLKVRLQASHFVSTHHGFVEVDSSKNQPQKNAKEKKLKQPVELTKATGFIASAQALSRKTRINRILGYLISFAYGFNPKVDKELNVLISKIYKLIAKSNLKFEKIITKFIISSRKFSSLKSENSSLESLRHPFQPGDIILTCGLDWDNSILEKLLEVKSQIDLKIVTVVYDLIPILHPEFIQNRRHVSKLLGHFSLLTNISDLILVNTSETKQHLENFCKNLAIDPPYISIIPWGVGFSKDSSSMEFGILSENILKSGYVLAVGTIEIRKNYQLLLNVVRLAEERNLEIPHFVFVGQPGWGTTDLIQQLQTDENLKSKVTWLQNSSDEELRWLYENSKCVVSPSFDEGYGLPVAEAQLYGKSVILSDIAVYRELFPNGVFCSPNDPSEWLNALIKLPFKEQGYIFLAIGIKLQNYS